MAQIMAPFQMDSIEWDRKLFSKKNPNYPDAQTQNDLTEWRGTGKILPSNISP